MSLPNTYFTKTEGGLLKTLPSKDPISGLLFFNDNIPALWSENSTSNCNWSGGTYYIAEDIVYEDVNKLFYKALVSNTSSTFSTDLAAGKWEQIEGENIKLVRRVLDLENLGILENSTDHSAEYYQVSEFFRMNPNGYLYINISPVPSSYDFSELYDFQSEVDGDLRQVGVFNTIPYNNTEVTALQLISDQLSIEYMPLQILYTANFTGTTLINSLSTLRSLDAEKVSVIIGMDGSGKGYSLYNSLGYSMCDVGAVLGAVSSVLVNESIASPELVNFASSELDLPLFGNGERVKDKSTSQLEDLYDKGYLFFKKFRGNNGTYIVDTLTCTDELSDYFDIQLNRTMDKVIRNSRSALLPKLHSKILLADDGTISPIAISLLTDIVSAPLLTMKSDTEISNFVVEIDPDQNVLQDSTVDIDIRILPYATARWINIVVGFSASI